MTRIFCVYFIYNKDCGSGTKRILFWIIHKNCVKGCVNNSIHCRFAWGSARRTLSLRSRRTIGTKNMPSKRVANGHLLNILRAGGVFRPHRKFRRCLLIYSNTVHLDSKEML